MADLPYISKLTVPVTVEGITTATTYEIKDAWARNEISSIETSLTGAMHYKGITTTAISDGSTTSTLTIDGKSVTFGADDAGAVVIYSEKEFVWNGSKWQEFGSTGSLKALAFADTASGSYTTVTGVSTNTTTEVTPTITVSATTNSEGNYQPAGSVAAPSISAAAPGSGESANYTPAGSVAAPTITAATPGQDESANYTPAGSITGTAVTVGSTTVTEVATVGTLPTFSYTSGTETITFTSGTLPTTNTATVGASGSATVTDGTFTGTGTLLTASAPAFTGTGTLLSASAPAFTGTKVQLSGSSTAVTVPATYTVSTGTDTVTVTPDTV